MTQRQVYSVLSLLFLHVEYRTLDAGRTKKKTIKLKTIKPRHSCKSVEIQVQSRTFENTTLDVDLNIRLLIHQILTGF